MKKAFLYITAAACVLISGCATTGGAALPSGNSTTAQDSSSNQTTSTATASKSNRPYESSDDPYKIVCKIVTYTGSRIKKRMCMTQLEWEITRREGIGFHEEVLRRSNHGPL